MQIDGFEADMQSDVARLEQMAAPIFFNVSVEDKAHISRVLAERQELLRQIAEQGEKLKVAEALASAAMLGKSAAEHRVSALCTERDGLKARLGRMTEEQDNMLGALAAYEDQVQALEQRIAGAKVCSHIYTRVALTSTTNCPACTNGIVWPEPAEQTAAPVAEGHVVEELCEDCPPRAYPTNDTRCSTCPLRSTDAI